MEADGEPGPKRRIDREDRAAPLFEVALELGPPARPGRAQRLSEELRAAVLDGRLAPGSRLPSSRRGRAVFQLSRNSVAGVYEQLADEGLVELRRGSGAYVSRAPGKPPPPATSARDGEAPDRRLDPLWTGAQMTSALDYWRADTSALAEPGTIEMRPAIVDPRLFPMDAFRSVMARKLRELEVRPPRHRGPRGNQGSFALRLAISRHVALTRAIAVEPDDILVTAGAQQAFDLIARALVRAGETVVAVEDPGYPPLRAPFLAAGARLMPARVDTEGLVVDELPAGARIVCVSPSHQFPLGATLSPARRAALTAFAERTDAVVVEDDYDGEFRHDGDPIAPLRAGAAAAESTFYVGTFSKSMSPALRLGFVIPPRWALATLTAIKNANDWHSPVALQLWVAGFIDEGRLARHVRKMRGLYKSRRDHLVAGLQHGFAGQLRPLVPRYGMQLAVLTDEDCDTRRLLSALARRRVNVLGLHRFDLGTATTDGFVMGVGATDVAQIDQALEHLGKALAEA